MRSTLGTVLVAVALALAGGCGPSSGQIREAREARYPGERAEVFRLAVAAVEASQPVEAADADAGTIVTTARWYEPDGSYLGTGDVDRQGGMRVATAAGSVQLGFRVLIVDKEPPFQVRVEPMAAQMRANYSAPYVYLPDDPAMPGWISGKVDNLQLDVHARLSRWLAPKAAGDGSGGAATAGAAQAR